MQTELFKTEEIWKTIPIEPKYEASNKGRIRNKTTKKLLKQHKNRYGYNIITLNKKTYSISRIIYTTHKENITKEMIIDHIDGNKTNNTINNLRQCTKRQNNSYTNRVRQSKHGTGVRTYNNGLTYYSKIRIDNKEYTLSIHKTAKEASNRYQDALKNITNNPDWRPKQRTKYKNQQQTNTKPQRKQNNIQANTKQLNNI